MRPCVPVKTVGLSELLQEGGLGGADSEAGGEFPHDGEASHQAAPQGPAEAPSRPLAEQRPFASLHLLLPRPPVTCCGFQGGEGALEKKLRAWWLLSWARDKARAGTRASATWPALLGSPRDLCFLLCPKWGIPALMALRKSPAVPPTSSCLLFLPHLFPCRTLCESSPDKENILLPSRMPGLLCMSSHT